MSGTTQYDFREGDKVTVHIGHGEVEGRITQLTTNESGDDIAVVEWTNQSGEHKSAHRKLNHLKHAGRS